MKRLPAPTLVCLALIVSPIAPAGSGEMGTRDAFFERLRSLCGEVFAGQSTFPEEGSFTGKLLVAEIAECGDSEIRIPFAVGDDHSRTWILTRGEDGLLLKHDHRHEDGSPDEITMYGGWAGEGGSEWSQSFAADDHTKLLIPEAATNVWTITLGPEGSEGDELVYELERHEAPRFQAVLVRKSSLHPD